MTPPNPTLNSDNQNVQFELFPLSHSPFLLNRWEEEESLSIDQLQHEPFKTRVKILLLFQKRDSRSVGQIHAFKVSTLYSLKDNRKLATIPMNIYKITLYD